MIVSQTSAKHATPGFPCAEYAHYLFLAQMDLPRLLYYLETSNAYNETAEALRVCVHARLTECDKILSADLPPELVAAIEADELEMLARIEDDTRVQSRRWWRGWFWRQSAVE